MDNTLLTAILGAAVAIAGSFAGVVRWGVGRLAKSQDAATKALLENARSNAELTAQVIAMHQSIERVVDILLGIQRPSEDSKSRRSRVKTRPEGLPHRRIPDDDDSGDYGG